MLLLSDIPPIVQRLVKRFGTHNPFQIAKKLGITILYGDFGDEVFGFYNKQFRMKFIHLNSKLNNEEMLFCCAHELIHAVCHPDENTPKLSKITLRSQLKIEAQANYGATCLLLDGSHNDELNNPSKYDILNYYRLPMEMIEYIEMGIENGTF